MSFSGAVQWWDDWHLRILVLGSLFLQYFLFFSAAVRRLVLPFWLRLFMWLAYQGGDALAIYALATLFNRYRQLPGDGSGLEVLWAPVLLIHLGGQHPMTAYSIEDNELWMRRAITVVSQVTVTLYVFCKLWSGEKRLLLAAILMFIVGIIRSCQKPWALKSATTGVIANTGASVVPFPPSVLSKQGMVALFWQICTCGYGYGFKSSELLVAVAEGQENLPQEFAQEVRKLVLESELAQDQEKAKKLAVPSASMYVTMILGDIPIPYSIRIKILQDFIPLDFLHAYHLSDRMLVYSFYLLYTRNTMLISRLALCTHLLLPFLTLASFILFCTGQKHYRGYNATDVKVTYILFCCTAVLDFLLLLFGPFITYIESVKVSQCSLLLCGSRAKRPTILMKLATLVSCKDYVNTHCYIEQAPSACSTHIVQLVHGYVRDGWKEYIHSADTYRRFNSRRGDWTLRKRKFRHVRWSLNMAFDRSVLLWHIATELCYRSTTNQNQEYVAGSKVISNYMAYLLCIRPEMLMPGTRSSIFMVACHDVEVMLDHDSPLGGLVPSAHRLKQQLLELHDEGERWEVVRGVWVEKLCYCASRCRGYLHAKNLSEGVELLSRVWLLLLFMGMETFADRFQKPRPPLTKTEEGQDDVADRADKNEITISIV